MATTATDRLAELFDIHHERLFRLALRMASDREEARDLVQETFLRAAARPGSLPAGESGGEAWLVRTLVNLCRDRWRRKAVRERLRSVILKEEVGEGGGEDALLARAEVRAALLKLSPRRRAVVALCELDGRTAGEAARLLGIAEVTVRWHLLAARRDLARILVEPPAANKRRTGDER